MIFYFSGTGNSLWAARQVGEAFGERLISIADELRRPEAALAYPLRDDERVFFVFPVHSWGPAVLVTRFIARLRLDRYRDQPVYALCTCGDNCTCDETHQCGEGKDCGCKNNEKECGCHKCDCDK